MIRWCCHQMNIVCAAAAAAVAVADAGPDWRRVSVHDVSRSSHGCRQRRRLKSPRPRSMSMWTECAWPRRGKGWCCYSLLWRRKGWAK
ncbi:MAG: hypothetical protein JOS17DRAFT_743762 [Linnemannia elongata]|nr:MAG: hypothetical protein JOS17DRAFT_743762 [Linnemannia elongata]